MLIGTKCNASQIDILTLKFPILIWCTRMSIQPFNLCINRINLKSFATLTWVTCHKNTYIDLRNWLHNLASGYFLNINFLFANKPHHHHHHHHCSSFPLGTLVALGCSCLNIWSSTRISSFLFIIVLICNMSILNILSSLFQIVLGILCLNSTCFCNSWVTLFSRQMCPMYLSCM